MYIVYIESLIYRLKKERTKERNRIHTYIQYIP